MGMGVGMGVGKDCLTLASQIQGQTQEKKSLENVLNSPLASGMVFLHITRFSPEPENILYPMATSKVAYIIRELGDGNSVDVKGMNLKEGMRENTGTDTKIRD